MKETCGIDRFAPGSEDDDHEEDDDDEEEDDESDEIAQQLAVSCVCLYIYTCMNMYMYKPAYI